MLLRDLSLISHCVPQDMSCGRVYDLFSADEDLSGVAVVRDFVPLGLVDRNAFMVRLADRFGRPLFEQKSITNLMDPDPLIVADDTSIDALSEHIATSRPGALQQGFIVTRNGRFAGLGSGLDLLRANVDLTALRLRQLEHARATAEEASETKSRFLATMSHEIRTPLNGIIGLSQVLSGTALADEQREFVGIIHESGQSLLDIVNEVLDMSRIEAGRLEVSAAPFETLAPVNAVASLLGAKARIKGLTFDVSVAPGLPGYLVGDQVRIRQILMNLVGNAIKFTDRGRVCLCAGGKMRADGRIELSFTVADTGIGIDAAQIPHLFEPFVQADSSTTRLYGGTGLGLAISRDLARLMDGDIVCASAQGKGSRFEVSILCDRLPGAESLSAELASGIAMPAGDAEIALACAACA